ncbi:hypothetical protein L593_06990 [Salinarchaeum sp. Harcht-Bsk1]|uniref:DUF2797 domain-containing protein n=1 Tax=Salinarchaeum sp. Harcht-Bsk1 TaxID=1333523 RepID=UPI00034235E1|nr:DUF2797 domain-containing protein [Salinarchaeum sp. Harcht-Bsk1]AGN01345.1 hypothetical protein L593_06990 [Salinarchaeum sp. Harcht-Bsk1]
MQVVDYVRTGHEGGPALLLADESGDLERLALDHGTELAYTLDERHCAGTLADGTHEACDAPATPYCDAHTHTWVCARCTGDCLKPEMDCHGEHAIYVAAFAPDVHKVGVTYLDRLPTRLQEQGADRAAHVRTVANGRIARELEAAIAERIPDRVRVPTKIAGLHDDVDVPAFEATLETELPPDFEVHEQFDFDYGLDLNAAPVPETTATGTVRGVKGRILVLEEHGTNYAVDLRDLLGYELAEGASDREKQASFGAFS